MNIVMLLSELHFIFFSSGLLGVAGLVANMQVGRYRVCSPI